MALVASVLARLLGELKSQGASVVVLDIPLDTPDPETNLAQSLPETPQTAGLRNELAKLPSPDDTFVSALGSVPTVTGFTLGEAAARPIRNRNSSSQELRNPPRQFPVFRRGRRTSADRDRKRRRWRTQPAGRPRRKNPERAASLSPERRSRTFDRRGGFAPCERRRKCRNRRRGYGPARIDSAPSSQAHMQGPMTFRSDPMVGWRFISPDPMPNGTCRPRIWIRAASLPAH